MTDEPTKMPVAGRLRRMSTKALTTNETAAIRALMTAAFGDDEDERIEDADWSHALGGTHVVLDVDGQILVHAAVVERELLVAGRPLRTGYVEAVATAPDHHGMGLGTQVMEAINAIIRDRFELGALGTGSHHFYERLGWRTWRGPSYVRTTEGDQPTPDDDGYILVLITETTPPIDLDDPISCEWRPGDVW
ncbi:MAG: GNAT family N-acetyltransferase [Chloroflexota bacterium]|nr:GNAT family N-acetyltransferase [Chloroflexota bacterium]